METDRPSISRSGERPVTRWRREHESNDNKSQIFSDNSSGGLTRSYSRMERPTSRRGIKTDITEYGISRPPTSGRSVLSRPPSPNILSSRISTPGGRINQMSSNNLTRMNSGLSKNYAQLNALVLDRPITQQGLAGIRPSSSKTVPRLARQIQDKKYYKQLLQRKIQELNQEIAAVTHEVEKQTGGRALYNNFDQKTRDIAAGLVDVQDQLSNYNAALDKMKFGVDKKEMELEARQLKELNDRKQLEIENVLQKRQQAESRLIELNKELEMNVDIGSKRRYEDIYSERNELQKQISNLQIEHDHLFNDKYKIEEKIASSPIKQEAYKLYFKIFEAEQKRNKLLEEERNSLNVTEEEKSKLLKNRDNNLNMSTAERQIIEIKKRISDAEQELEQLETDTDESSSEKQNKIHDRKKQLEKFNRLEEKIVQRLEKISNYINENTDSSVLTADDLEVLKELMDKQNFVNNSEKSYEELKEENFKLYQISNKLDVLESKIRDEVNQYDDNFKSMHHTHRQPFGLDDSEDFDEINKARHKDFSNQSDEYEQRKKMMEEPPTIKRDYSKLKEKIKENEIYRTISIFQDKLRIIKGDNDQTSESIEDSEENDAIILKEKLFSMIKQYNNFLINELKTVY